MLSGLITDNNQILISKVNILFGEMATLITKQSKHLQDDVLKREGQLPMQREILCESAA